MRKLKQVVWFCFAGCCCAGLVLLGGERSQSISASSGGTYCPYALYGQFGQVYYYMTIVSGSDCKSPYYSAASDMRLHQTGGCGTCPDPIYGTGQPIEIDPADLTLIPQPDPLFSGILR